MAPLSRFRKTRLELACKPLVETAPRGGPIPVRIEISNRSDREVVLRSVGIPWQSVNAIEFRVAGRDDFRPALREGLPPELPDVTIPPGGSIAGEIDLGHELLGPGDKSVAEFPGEYAVEGKVFAFVARPEHEDERVEPECGPFTIRVAETADAG